MSTLKVGDDEQLGESVVELVVGEGKERKKALRVGGEGRQGEHQKVIRFKSPTSFGTVPDSAKQSSPSGSSSSKKEGASAGRQPAEPCPPPAQQYQPRATAGAIRQTTAGIHRYLIPRLQALITSKGKTAQYLPRYLGTYRRVLCQPELQGV